MVPVDDTAPPPDRPRVSVIVPVYDPGPYLERCIDSLLAQTMSPGALELIFVDDGSTDGSGERLDRLAAEHDHVRVIHQENSGWPGKPRNVGIDAARGEYVYFADADDKVGPEAIERLHVIAVRDGVDIVLGKIVGHHRGAPRSLFTEDRSRITLDDAPFMDSLTVQKLFKASFLEQHGLRFPEGRRRLEDLVFVMRAYFAVDRMSILASYDCYFAYWRDDRANITAQPVEPSYYYPFLREVIGVLEANTTPGPRRDRWLERFARDQLMGRLGGRKSFLDQPQEYREKLFTEVKRVVEDHVPPSVDPLLNPMRRLRMALTRADRLDLLTTLAAYEADISARTRLRAPLAPRGAIVLEVDAWWALGDEPWPLVRHDGVLELALPADVAVATPREARALPEPPGHASLVLRRRDDSAEVEVPTSCQIHEEVDANGRVSLRYALMGSIGLSDPATGRPLRPGRWHCIVRIEQAGIGREARIAAVASVRPDTRAFEIDGPTASAVGSWAGEKRHLGLEVRGPMPRGPVARLRRGVRALGRRLRGRATSSGL